MLQLLKITPQQKVIMIIKLIVELIIKISCRNPHKTTKPRGLQEI